MFSGRTPSFVHPCAPHGAGARAGEDDSDAVEGLADEFQRVEDGGAGNDGRAVLVIVKDRNIEDFTQPLLDVEALRGFDVFEVDAAEGRLQRGDDVDQLVRVGFIHFDVEHIDAGELLEQHALAFHHRLGGQRADIAQTQHRSAVADDRHQIAARGELAGLGGIVDDGLAGEGHARRIRQRQIALGQHRLGRGDLDLAGRLLAVVIEGGLFEVVGGHRWCGSQRHRRLNSTLLPEQGPVAQLSARQGDRMLQRGVRGAECGSTRKRPCIPPAIPTQDRAVGSINAGRQAPRRARRPGPAAAVRRRPGPA